MTDTTDPRERRRGSGTGGRFFVLGRGQWERLWAIKTSNRMNVLLAYLTLLAGTGADHRMTKWSLTAIRNHTGMGKDSARTAVVELLTAGMIERATSSTPAKPHYHIAARADSAATEPIFLPVALVTGLTGSDTSMLHRLRETGDTLVLRLLIDLYGDVTTDAPFSVPLSKMRTYRDHGAAAEKAMEIGAHAVWELAEPDMMQANVDRSRYEAKGDERKFWDRVRLLESLGATHREPWLCSSADADADPIYPLSADSNLPTLIDEAARTLLAGQYCEREWKSEAHPGPLVVLPVHHQPPAIQMFTRLRIEADTPGRRGAYGERMRLVAHWIEQYDRLGNEAAVGKFGNPLRTQPGRDSAAECPHQGDQGDQGDQGHQVRADL